jgi:hypothetical protein
MSAMPMGAPGWPELACWTASIARARIGVGHVSLVGDAGLFCV